MKPIVQVLRILGIVVLVEAMIMMILAGFDLERGMWEALLDGTLLVLFSGPPVYYFVVQAMTRDSRSLGVLESERQYGELVEKTSDLLWATDEHQILTQCSPRSQQLLGYEPDELVGTPAGGLLLPWEMERAGREFERLVAARAPFVRVENVNLHKNGTEVVLETSGIPVFDRTGRFKGYRGIDRNITAQKRSEQALKESEARFRATAESATDAIVSSDQAGRIIFWNRAAEKVFGYPAAEVLDRSLSLILPDRIPESASERTGIVGTAGESPFAGRTAEVSGVRKNGEAFSAELSLSRWEQGTEVYFTAMIRDITERQRLEGERKLLAKAISQLEEMIVITDPSGAIQYANQAFTTVTGFSHEEGMGRNPNMLKSGVQDSSFYENLWRTLRRGRTWTGMIVNRRKDGSVYEQDTSISPVVDPSGVTEAYVCVARDVTQITALEEHLRHTQKVEAVGQVASGIAHDFNNLLTVIQANADLLLSASHPPDEGTAEMLREIQTCAGSGASLVKRLLTFSRKDPLDLQPLDLAELADQLTPVLRRLLPETIRVQFSTPPPPPLPHATADRGAVEQILMNLATNARDAMPKGGVVRVSVSQADLSAEDLQIHPWAEAGEYVTLAVSDTGTGMSEEVQARVFEPFFTTKAAGEGTGLGLAVIFQLMKRQGGLVNIYSEVGRGTTVKALFRSAGDRRPAEVHGTSVEGSLPGGSETVLVMEDQDSLRNSARRVLQRLGYRVLLAADGVEGLRVLAETGGAIDLVLADVVMPEMGGIEVYRQLRAQGRPVAFLLTSGYSEETIADGDPNLRDIPFLEKPWTVAELARMVRETLDHGRRGEVAPRD